MASFSSSPTYSSSSVPSSLQQYQVFINFRGELRNGLVSHLFKELRRKGINAFIDEIETRGQHLDILFSRIEESRIALAIFSVSYAESEWCMDELVKINECVASGKLVVIPIFYHVKAGDVNKQEGPFGERFKSLKARTCDVDKHFKWKKALEDVTQRMGITLGAKSEAEFLEKIVQGVIEGLSMDVGPVAPEAPIAGDEETPEAPLCDMDTRLTQLEDMLNFECEITRTIGVVGMPGIGKTTLASKLYEKSRGDFQRHVFLHDVRGMWKGSTMDHRKFFMKELLNSDSHQADEFADLSPKAVTTLLLSTKSLVVLDNVSDKKQIEVLLGEREWVKSGSKIIITTSDMSVIEGIVDDTYEVLRLSARDSLLYFNYFAFGSKDHTPEGNLMKFSRLFVDYAKGNPFALKILGVDLNGKDETRWKETLDKLEESPTKPIQELLQISYDGLEQLQKDAFLDIACFFKSGDKCYVRSLVESCGTDAVSEIDDLASKFLINISGGRVEMHDLLYTFGKELGSQGSRSLWNYKDVVDTLMKGAEADSVRGVFVDIYELKDKRPVKPYTFSRMRNLRYLKIYNSRCHRECKADCKLSFPDGLEFPLDEIRYFYWLKFPLKKLPEDFNPKNLTDLNLPYSQIEELWEGLKDTPKLRWVDLSHSSKLCKLSGLQNAERLEKLNLEGCTSLEELPGEMTRMKRLIFLNMRGCTSLRVLPHINLIFLETLILTNCLSLKEFRVISDNLETLNLDGTAISQLPEDMVKLQRLIVLNLKNCEKLVAVPECLGKLKSLQELVLSCCSKLKTFPILIENMKCLQILLLDGTSITDMSKILQFNSSKVEDLPELRRDMNGLSSLQRLCLSKNDKITNLEIDMSLLHHLKLLNLKECKNLASISLLPPNLEILDAYGCEKLKTVASPMAQIKRMEKVHSKFIFINCKNLEQAAKNSITSYAQRKIQLNALRSYKEGSGSEALFITSFPGSEVPSWFNHRKVGRSLKLSPPHWCDNNLSTIALCAVVAFPNTQERFSIKCTCEFTNDLGKCTRFSCILGGGWTEPRMIDSDHVFIGYACCSHVKNHVQGSREHQKCVPTNASIEYEVIDGTCEILNCGLSLVYEEPNHVITEGDSNGTSSVGENIVYEEPNHVVTVGDSNGTSPVGDTTVYEKMNHVVTEGDSNGTSSVGESIVYEEPNHVVTEGDSDLLAFCSLF